MGARGCWACCACCRCCARPARRHQLVGGGDGSVWSGAQHPRCAAGRRRATALQLQALQQEETQGNDWMFAGKPPSQASRDIRSKALHANRWLCKHCRARQGCRGCSAGAAPPSPDTRAPTPPSTSPPLPPPPHTCRRRACRRRSRCCRRSSSRCARFSSSAPTCSAAQQRIGTLHQAPPHAPCLTARAQHCMQFKS